MHELHTIMTFYGLGHGWRADMYVQNYQLYERVGTHKILSLGLEDIVSNTQATMYYAMTILALEGMQRAKD